MAPASAEKPEHTGPAKKERVASVPENNWQVRQSRPCQKEKKQSCLSRVPDRKVKKSQGEREPHLGEKKRDQGGSMERVDSTVKEGRFQAGD